MSGYLHAPISGEVVVEKPTAADAAAMWRIARDSRSLDLNSSYAYLLWCTHFRSTSAVAKLGDEPIGFVTGYVPPEYPDTIMIWQIAVADQYRGRGVALAMLNAVIDHGGYRWLKTTIGPANQASTALFTALADQRLTIISRTSMFTTADFPDSHEREDLYTVGPLAD